MSQAADTYPSLLWVTIPSVLILSAYFANKWYKKYKLKKYGIGKGAPGFQTNVRQLRVTPEIAERLRRGEYVSAEEIAAAAARADEEAKKRPPQGVVEVGFGPRETTETKEEQPVNEWLPENITNPKKRGKAKRR
ncbi:hypothetical protein P691DRAFT_804021 [Macrolepiota fuliginosa MF-IS2]|uniref:Uncharacterized protein n=1 Tax=Macrolepiota fuliginosa MF-IS2 TaxID=1400762 RepID=A0A9P5X854_9AGAR|nr:hypothetical protein P691DRAFT_804021 [Macrolepiota fuliginosa MF-IS2]